jgi:phosphoserine phosphatase
VEMMADYYGFDDFVGREDEQENGRFTGKSTTPVFGKDSALKGLIEKNSAILRGSYAVGDSHSDIKMLEMVDNPIAFNPEKRLFDHAVSKGWRIVVERKNMIYELETNGKGYTLVETNP